jgi:hypothetical protein
MSDRFGQIELDTTARTKAVYPLDANPDRASLQMNRRHLLGMGVGATAAAGVGLSVADTALAQTGGGPGLQYSDGIAASRTMIVLQGNAAALQRRLPSGWELAPYAGDDLRGTSLRGANMLVPFHEVYAVRSHDGRQAGLPQSSYVPFISQARNTATGALGHFHWFTYTEDPEGVPGKYRDGKLAQITRSQTFTKQRRGETEVRETFSAVADGGEVHLSLAYQQGGMLIWATADRPNLPLYAATDPSIVRWYQEDQVLNIVRSDPLKVNRVSEITLNVKGELGDVFDGSERVVAVVIQRPYVRQVYVQ